MTQNWSFRNTWLIVCVRNLGEMFYRKGYCEVSEWYFIPFIRMFSFPQHAKFPYKTALHWRTVLLFVLVHPFKRGWVRFYSFNKRLSLSFAYMTNDTFVYIRVSINALLFLIVHKHTPLVVKTIIRLQEKSQIHRFFKINVTIRMEVHKSLYIIRYKYSTLFIVL